MIQHVSPGSDEDLAGFSSFASEVTFALLTASSLALSLIGCGRGSASVWDKLDLNWCHFTEWETGWPKQKSHFTACWQLYLSSLWTLWLCSWQVILLRGTKAISFQSSLMSLMRAMIDLMQMNGRQCVWSPVFSEADFLFCRTAAGSDIMRKEPRLVAWIISFYSEILEAPPH